MGLQRTRSHSRFRLIGGQHMEWLKVILRAIGFLRANSDAIPDSRQDVKVLAADGKKKLDATKTANAETDRKADAKIREGEK